METILCILSWGMLIQVIGILSVIIIWEDDKIPLDNGF